MAWRCRFLTARPRQDGSVIAEHPTHCLISTQVHVSYIKTDMQGADYAAISSLPVDVLRRTPFLLTEVWLENVQSYVGFRNDFCRDWLPFMTAAGYSLQFMRLILSLIHI